MVDEFTLVYQDDSVIVDNAKALLVMLETLCLEYNSDQLIALRKMAEYLIYDGVMQSGSIELWRLVKEIVD